MECLGIGESGGVQHFVKQADIELAILKQRL
jgi:hypothetical protein